MKTIFALIMVVFLSGLAVAGPRDAFKELLEPDNNWSTAQDYKDAIDACQEVVLCADQAWCNAVLDTALELKKRYLARRDVEDFRTARIAWRDHVEVAEARRRMAVNAKFRAIASAWALREMARADNIYFQERRYAIEEEQQLTKERDMLDLQAKDLREEYESGRTSMGPHQYAEQMRNVRKRQNQVELDRVRLRD